MEKLYEMKLPPLAYAYALYIWGLRSGLYWDWKPESEVTSQAIAHVEAALHENDCNEENRPILQRFLKCLKAGQSFAAIRVLYQDLVLLAANPSTTTAEVENCAANIKSKVQQMEGFLANTFSYDWATPLGGDIKN